MKLAIDGGPKAAPTPWPARSLFDAREKKAVDELFDRAIQTGNAFGYDGPEEKAYCNEFAEWLGGGYADAVSSGTTAIYVALRALELPPYSEVLCSPITDPGGVMPIPLCNLIPIPVDAAPGSFNVSAKEIEARITPRTSAILVTHISGIPVDMGPVMKLARERKLPVIEDCAQSHGATCRGRLVGTFGTIGAFSTMFGKHHATGGQGGVVFTKDEKLYQTIRRHSDRGKPYGLPPGSGNVVAALNFNLNDLSACIGRVQLKKLPKIIAARQARCAQLAEACKGLKAMRLLAASPRCASTSWLLYFELKLEKLTAPKETIVNAMAAEGLPVMASYPYIWTQAPWYINKAVFGEGLPWTAPGYKGDANAEYPVPNIIETESRCFRMAWHERVSARNVKETAAALKKVEAAFLR